MHIFSTNVNTQHLTEDNSNYLWPRFEPGTNLRPYSTSATQLILCINPRKSRTSTYEKCKFRKDDRPITNSKAADSKLRHRIKRDLFTFQTLCNFFLYRTP